MRGELRPLLRLAGPVALAEIGWTGEEGLLANAAALARHATLGILHFLPPMDPRDFPDRKMLADHVRAAICEVRK